MRMSPIVAFLRICCASLTSFSLPPEMIHLTPPHTNMRSAMAPATPVNERMILPTTSGTVSPPRGSGKEMLEPGVLGFAAGSGGISFLIQQKYVSGTHVDVPPS